MATSYYHYGDGTSATTPTDCVIISGADWDRVISVHAAPSAAYEALHALDRLWFAYLAFRAFLRSLSPCFREQPVRLALRPAVRLDWRRPEVRGPPGFRYPRL